MSKTPEMSIGWFDAEGEVLRLLVFLHSGGVILSASLTGTWAVLVPEIKGKVLSDVVGVVGFFLFGLCCVLLGTFSAYANTYCWTKQLTEDLTGEAERRNMRNRFASLYAAVFFVVLSAAAFFLGIYGAISAVKAWTLAIPESGG